jgi:hypothetical protein
MATSQATSAIAVKADWEMQETVYDVWEPLLHRNPVLAVAMASEMQMIAQRYAEQYLPDVFRKLWPEAATITPQRGGRPQDAATVAPDTR